MPLRSPLLQGKPILVWNQDRMKLSTLLWTSALLSLVTDVTACFAMTLFWTDIDESIDELAGSNTVRNSAARARDDQEALLKRRKAGTTMTSVARPDVDVEAIPYRSDEYQLQARSPKNASTVRSFHVSCGRLKNKRKDM